MSPRALSIARGALAANIPPGVMLAITEEAGVETMKAVVTLDVTSDTDTAMAFVPLAGAAPRKRGREAVEKLLEEING